MEINVPEQKKRIEIRLTSDESSDSSFLEAVEWLINEYCSRKFFAVIFRSGTDAFNRLYSWTYS